MLAAKPILRTGKNLHVNTLWEKATNQDYDGDASQIHVPVSDEAVGDAWKMLPSKQLFSDKKPKDLLMAPTNEPIMGLYRATKNLGTPATGSVKKFKDEAEAWKAYHDGQLKMTDRVEIGGDFRGVKMKTAPDTMPGAVQKLIRIMVRVTSSRLSSRSASWAQPHPGRHFRPRRCSA
jgi:DNA-directed RNA polymerase subunit beta'